MNPSSPTLSPDRTLAEAKQWLRERVVKGAICPCCNQLAKIYTRKFNSGMSVNLIKLMHLCERKEWVHVNEITKMPPIMSNADWRYLAYWGLIQTRTVESKHSDKKNSGYWQITPLGKDFVSGRCTLKNKIVVYNGQLLRTEGQLIYIKEALGDKFNYPELMGYV